MKRSSTIEKREYDYARKNIDIIKGYYNEIAIEEIEKRCYFCGFREILDKHHIYPRNMAFKPYWMYVIMLHRGVAKLVIYKQRLFLYVIGRRVEIPYKVGKYINIYKHENKIISYGKHSGEAYSKFKEEELDKDIEALILKKLKGFTINIVSYGYDKKNNNFVRHTP